MCSSMRKKNQKYLNDFWHRHFESPISALYDELAKLGKASQDTYNPGLWLILLDLLKNWVAEGVASVVNDFNSQYWLMEFVPCQLRAAMLVTFSQSVNDALPNKQKIIFTSYQIKFQNLMIFAGYWGLEIHRYGARPIISVAFHRSLPFGHSWNHS